MNTCILLFTRDLRLPDNYALKKATTYDRIIPIFCFENKQIVSNSYKSENAIQFMIESVRELNDEMNGCLNIFSGSTIDSIKKILHYDEFDLIVSKDYTPFAKKRTSALQQICREVIEVENHKLCSKDVLTGDGNIYSVFTPYYKKVIGHKVPTLLKTKKITFINLKKNKNANSDSINKIEKELSFASGFPGGRSNGLNILKGLKCCRQYATNRDTPRVYTSRLSAHHKFGTVSIRETYWAIQKYLKGKSREMMTRQLYWRDFYYNICEEHPHVFGKSYKEKYDELEWENDSKWFSKWCKGKTGFPIVDAGMRQLNTEGWMHNRLRMIVSSFLTKDLLIDWRKGEKYFAQKLVDYDPCQNNGGWQWASGTGTDAQPYFRIFNPWSQSKKFDPDGTYIKKYVSELNDIDPKYLHTEKGLSENKPTVYPEPIVIHKEQRERALAMYKQIQ